MWLSALLALLDLKWPPPGGVVPPGPALVLWTAAYLSRNLNIPAIQQLRLFTEARTRVAETGKIFAERTAAGQELPTFMLVFADNRYALWTGNDNFLDTVTGEFLPPLRSPPIHTVALDLRALFRWHRQEAYWYEDVTHAVATETVAPGDPDS